MLFSMVAEMATAQMHIGYARNAREERVLLNLGLKAARIYVEGRGAETLAKVSLRKGDELHTVLGLRALGDSRYDLVTEVDRIHALGAVVVDAQTRQRSDRDGVAMLDAALRQIRGERVMPPGKAERMQAASVKIRTKGRMPAREALAIWRDPKWTTGEAIERMRGWSARTAYVRFGKRGLPTGRRGK